MRVGSTLSSPCCAVRTKELLDAADIGELQPRPFTVLACPNPNAYTLATAPDALQRQCSRTFNVDRLKPFFERAGGVASPRAGVRRGAGG